MGEIKMKDYEMILWCINEQRNAPLGTDIYYPLMLKILINNGYTDKEYLRDNPLSFFNYIISQTYLKNNTFTLDGYCKQTLKVVETFDKLYKEDKESAMHLKTSDFIEIINKGVNNNE